MKDNGRPGYAGKISNAGGQKVEAPFKTSTKSNAVIRTGDDLRAGKGSGKKK